MLAPGPALVESFASMATRRPPRPSTLLAALCALLLPFAQACQAAPRYLTPDEVRASTATDQERDAALQSWQTAIELANEFLASSFNRTLPTTARLQLAPDGMRFVTSERAMPVNVVLVDDYRTSSCVCATVDTYKDVVYAHRPWDAARELPIETCNTFFRTPVSSTDGDVALATHVLRMATILYFERHTHISTWEWFKCQWLEWLIGSGHHEFSMQRPNAVTREMAFFWHGVEPATPTVRRVLKLQAPSAEAFEHELAERSRAAPSWQERFEAYLRERDQAAGAAATQDR